MSDYTVMIDGRSKVFLGGPPLVKMATGEESTGEQLGGAEMHAKVSGLADHLAVDEHDGIRTTRRIVTGLSWDKLGSDSRLPADPPVHDPDDLLGVASVDLCEPFGYPQGRGGRTGRVVMGDDRASSLPTRHRGATMAVEESDRSALLRAAAQSWGEEAADTLSELLPPSRDRPATGRDIDGVLAAMNAMDARFDAKLESVVDRITASFERRISDAVTTQTRTLVFSQLGLIVVIAALAFGLR